MFGYTALIMASQNGHHKVVYTLLEYGVDVNAKNNVRNQMMMMMMIMIMITIVFTIMIMMLMIVFNDDSVDNRY
jgi:ankyrin repeat protein